jgi:hypothetical protein
MKHTTRALIVGIALAALGFTTAEAEEPSVTGEGRCYVEFKNKVYIDGPCLITVIESESFKVVSPAGKDVAYVLAKGDEHFAVMNEELFGGEVSPIGPVTLDKGGACWNGMFGRVCTWTSVEGDEDDEEKR